MPDKAHDNVTTGFVCDAEKIVELKIIAARRRCSIGELLRDAVDRILAAEHRENDQPPMPLDPFAALRPKK